MGERVREIYKEREREIKFLQKLLYSVRDSSTTHQKMVKNLLLKNLLHSFGEVVI